MLTNFKEKEIVFKGKICNEISFFKNGYERNYIAFINGIHKYEILSKNIKGIQKNKGLKSHYHLVKNNNHHLVFDSYDDVIDFLVG